MKSVGRSVGAAVGNDVLLHYYLKKYNKPPSLSAGAKQRKDYRNRVMSKAGPSRAHVQYVPKTFDLWKVIFISDYLIARTGRTAGGRKKGTRENNGTRRRRKSMGIMKIAYRKLVEVPGSTSSTTYLYL